MNMSAEEIKRDFLEAKDRKQQIGILADLNCCTRPEIIGVLKAAGVDYRMLPRERKKAVERTGETDGQTAAETGPASAPATPASTSTHTHTPAPSAESVLPTEAQVIANQSSRIAWLEAENAKLWALLELALKGG